MSRYQVIFQNVCIDVLPRHKSNHLNASARRYPLHLQIQYLWTHDKLAHTVCYGTMQITSHPPPTIFPHYNLPLRHRLKHIQMQQLLHIQEQPSQKVQPTGASTVSAHQGQLA